VLTRGHYCPKEHQQHLELAAFYPKVAVAYTQMATIATDDHHVLQEFRASVGAQWPFLSDPGRTVQKDLDIQEYTDPDHDPMIPHTLVLKPGLVIHSVYNGYWFWGAPVRGGPAPRPARRDERDPAGLGPQHPGSPRRLGRGQLGIVPRMEQTGAAGLKSSSRYAARKDLGWTRLKVPAPATGGPNSGSMTGFKPGTRVHMWTQIVGKVRMALTPMLNHWWHVTLYVTPRGLSTSTIPYGGGAFDIEFDFCGHRLHVRSSDGTAGSIVLGPKSVAAFHAEVFETLARLGIQAPIRAVPNEVDPAIPFAEDHQHASYDPVAVRTFWQQLIQADRVLNEFRSRFRGKASPVHLFWGGMDWPTRASPDGRRPATPAGSRTAPTGSWWRATPTKSAAAGSGPAAGTRVRFMPTPTRSQQGSAGTQWNRPRQPTTKSWDSICCPMGRFAARPTPTSICCSSCIPRTLP
jgi:hypothetical protein